MYISKVLTRTNDLEGGRICKGIWKEMCGFGRGKIMYIYIFFFRPTRECSVGEDVAGSSAYVRIGNDRGEYSSGIWNRSLDREAARTSELRVIRKSTSLASGVAA